MSNNSLEKSNYDSSRKLEIFLYFLIFIGLIIAIFGIYRKEMNKKNSPFYIMKKSGDKFQNYPISDKKCMENIVYLVGSGKSITYTVMLDETGQPLSCYIDKKN